MCTVTKMQSRKSKHSDSELRYLTDPVTVAQLSPALTAFPYSPCFWPPIAARPTASSVKIVIQKFKLTYAMRMTHASADTHTAKTQLQYGVLVPKTDLRIQANGLIEELSIRVGLAKAEILPNTPPHIYTRQWLEQIQKALITLMGEIAVAPESFTKHEQSNSHRLDPNFIEELDARIAELESKGLKINDFLITGHNRIPALFDSARSGCRQAELAVWKLDEAQLLNPSKRELILLSLDRLADVLWLEARNAERTST